MLRHIIGNVRPAASRYLRPLSMNYGLVRLRQFSAENTADPLDLSNAKMQAFLEELRREFYTLRVGEAGNSPEAHLRMNQLNGIVTALETHRIICGNMISKEEIAKEKDEDMRQLLEEENVVYSDMLKKTDRELLEELLHLADGDDYPSLIFEVNAGVGGQEAMLFAKELYEMYINHFEYMGWSYDILEEDYTDIGGLRHANVIISSPEAYGYIRHEGGVHRVQRVPATEKSGRIHTSTASVQVIPRPANASIKLDEKDLKIETKRASGAGGQHVNTTDSAVRIVHLPSGMAVESQTERSQIKNKEIALKKLEAKLLQQQLQSAESSKMASRKAQQGNQDRNEKIRTYNFVQDRITDHRISGGTMHNLKEFLAGGDDLNALVQKLLLSSRRSNLEQMIQEWAAKAQLNNTVDTTSKQQSKGKN